MAPLSRYNYLGFRCVLGVSAISTSSNPAGSAEMLNAPSVASKNQLSLGKTVDLLRLIDPANDTVRGRWEWTPEGLKLVPKTAVSTIEFPYEPPEFYDFTIEFSVKEGKRRQVDQILTCQGVPTSWQMGAGYAPSGVFGLMMVDGIKAIEPSRTEAVALRERLSPDVRHRSTVQVRKNRIRAILDGKEILNWEGDFKRLDLESQSRLKSVNRLGIGGFATEAIFHLAELKAADDSSTKATNAAPKLSDEMTVAAARGGRLRAWGNFYARGRLLPIDVSKAAGYSDFVALAGDDTRLYALRKNQVMVALDSGDSRQPFYEKTEIQRLFRNRIWPHYQNDIFIIHRGSVPELSLKPSVGPLRAVAAGFYLGGYVCIPDTGEAFWLPANGNRKQDRPPPVDLLANAVDAVGISCGIGVVSREGRLHFWNFEEVIETSAEYSDIVEIQGGINFALCRKRDGSVLVWPPASYKKGYLPDRSVQRVPTLPPAVQVRCGSDVCAAQMPDGRWIGWGADPEVVAKISSIGKAVDIAIPGRPHPTTNHGYVAWIEPDALSGSAPASVLASGANESPPALGGSEVAASAGKSESSRNVTITDAVPLPKGPTTWTDIQGRSLVATFKSIVGDTVLLEIGGNIQPLSLATLSAGSRRLALAYQSRAGPKAATKNKPFINTIGMKFVPVPGTKVLFCMHETRRQDYAVYANEVPSVNGTWKFQNRDGVPCGDKDDHPVCGVNWEDAQAFCAWLSKKEDRTYRLPTDEQWSIAVGLGGKEKSGNGITPAILHEKEQTIFPWESSYPPKTKDEAGNYADSAFLEKFPNDSGMKEYIDGFPTTAPVMSFKPNKLGLYDMGGNVWEWMDTWWNAAKTDRVLRGASFRIHDRAPLLSSYRFHPPPGTRYYDYGFRIVLADDSDQPSAAH